MTYLPTREGWRIAHRINDIFAAIYGAQKVEEWVRVAWEVVAENPAPVGLGAAHPAAQVAWDWLVGQAGPLPRMSFPRHAAGASRARIVVALRPFWTTLSDEDFRSLDSKSTRTVLDRAACVLSQREDLAEDFCAILHNGFAGVARAR